MKMRFDITVYNAKYVDKPHGTLVNHALRVLPNGNLGALHKESVYPIYRLNLDNSLLLICLSDESFEISSCAFASAKTPLNFIELPEEGSEAKPNISHPERSKQRPKRPDQVGEISEIPVVQTTDHKRNRDEKYAGMAILSNPKGAPSRVRKVDRNRQKK